MPPDQVDPSQYLPADLASLELLDIDVAMTVLQPLFEPFARLMGEIGKGLVPAEGTEFSTGFREIMHKWVDAAFFEDSSIETVEPVLRELFGYLESWAITLRLASNADWLRQVEETRDILDEKPVGLDDLRSRLVG